MRKAGWIFLLMLFVACWGNKDGDQEEKPLARVGDKVLHYSDLPADMQMRLSGHDSIALLKVYVTNWVNQQVMYEKAIGNLEEDIPGIEKKVEDYRNSLIIYEYQRAFIEQQLDTSVTRDEMVRYYEQNQKNFELKRNIVRLRYVKLPNKSDDMAKAKKWFLSEDVSDRYKLLDYCEKNAANTFFDEESWLSFDDILKEIPIKGYDDEAFLSSNKFVELSDADYTYWVYIKSFRVKNSVSPFEMEEATIRNIIINQRKVKIMQEMERSLLEDARQNNQIQWYID